MEYNNSRQSDAELAAQNGLFQDAVYNPVIPISTVLNRLGLQPANRDDERSEDQLVNALSNPEWSVRAAAVQTLGQRGTRGTATEPIVAALRRALRDEQAEVRVAAIQVLGKIGGDVPLALLLHALQNDAAWLVRAMAALTLRTQTGESIPLEPLLHALQDEDESVRAATARALGTLGVRASLSALERALHDPAWCVREAAVLTLDELGQRVPAEILQLATEDSHAVVQEQKEEEHPQRRGRGPSRRAIMVGLAAVVIAGNSIVWSILLHRHRDQQAVVPGTTTTGQRAFSFYGPGYSALDAQGNLYVLDADLQQTQAHILKFSAAGALLATWSFKADTQPACITVDGPGNIYLSIQGTRNIYRLSSTGVLLPQWSVSEEYPVGLTLDQRGNVYVASYDGNTLLKYSPTGTLLATLGGAGTAAGQFSHPTTVAVDAQGNIYVVDQGDNRIQKLSPTGKPLAHWGSTGSGLGQFMQPGAIAVDGQGNVYITDGFTGIVQKFSSTGKWLAAWGGTTGNVQFGVPRGIAVDLAGHIYVSSVDLDGETFKNGRITVLSPTGQLLAVWK